MFSNTVTLYLAISNNVHAPGFKTSDAALKETPLKHSSLEREIPRKTEKVEDKWTEGLTTRSIGERVDSK